MKDNQYEQLFTELTAEFEAPAFTELDNEVAAAIGGGAGDCKLELYDNNNFTKLIGCDSGYLKDIKKTSSIIVNDGYWRLYADANYKGAAHTYGPGRSVLGPDLNNKVSSIVRVG